MYHRLLIPLFVISAWQVAASQDLSSEQIFSEYSVTISQNSLESDAELNLTLFDTGFGTLTKVLLEIEATYTTFLNLKNLTSQSQSSRVNGTAELIFSSDDLVALNPLLQHTGDRFDLVFDTGALNLSPDEFRTLDPLAPSQSRTFDLTSISPMLQSDSGGTFNLNFRALFPLPDVESEHHFDLEQTSHYDIDARITYVYSPVPEPGPLALITLSSLIPMWSRKRRA